MRTSFLFLIAYTVAIADSVLKPLPLTMDVDMKKVMLGKKLFADPILSKGKKISCMSCHNLKHNGADVVKLTEGANGKRGYFNVPTVYNAVFNFRQFWDGRAKDLREQALKPIREPLKIPFVPTIS